MPSLIQKYYVTSSGVNTNTLTTASFTPSNGEVIIAKMGTWDTTATMGNPSGGSQTFTSRVTVSPGANRSWVSISSATISGSPGSMTVASTHSGTASQHVLEVERWSSAVLASTPATGSATSGSGTPSGSITTTAANSYISVINSDWNARNPASRAYVNTANVTEENLLDLSGSSDVVIYNWYQSVAAAGSTSFGLTAPTLQNYSMAAIEIKDASVTPFQGWGVPL